MSIVRSISVCPRLGDLKYSDYALNWFAILPVNVGGLDGFMAGLSGKHGWKARTENGVAARMKKRVDMGCTFLILSPAWV